MAIVMLVKEILRHALHEQVDFFKKHELSRRSLHATNLCCTKLEELSFIKGSSSGETV